MKTTSRTLLAVGVCLLIGSNTQAQNLIANGDFGTGDLSGWSIASGGSAQTTISYDGGEGVPAGSGILDRVDSTLDDNKDILYQIVPVTNGNDYKFDADWKGDLYNGGDGRNWAEAIIFFTSSGAAIPDGTMFMDADIQYKIASAGGPHDPPASGFDWQSVLDSPDGGPVDGVFTATDDYMVVGFNLGGRDAADSRHTLVAPGFYYVDNVSVTAIPEPGTCALLALAVGGLAALRRLR